MELQLATAREQFVLGERLQAVEDDLFAAGKRHVRIQGVEGVFEWYAVGADQEPIEEAQPGDIEEIEDDLLMGGGRKVFTMETAEGSFIWRAKA